ncbi:hypothetical protein F4821DRAFT_257490 [Hypoxylon rubiginosum]|uniref:Uncharacterized protein n=1 Tax=Hypoxylon rubiginosum TaxID=110542 RepID=A0ACC0D8B3_9PEZI|nr:hypothetical protein F4821DRAFT_257490 [Hypoxylon rubiginosum]
MAPTSKSSAPGSSSSSKATTGNPAPDFAVNMNRIQMQLEARLKAARAFLPSRSDGAAIASGSSGSFSALHTSNPQSQSQSQSQLQQSRDESARAAAARRQAQEVEFAEDRGLDPNAGIGLVVRAPGTGGNESARDRDTAKLRGRLLGKRGRGAGGDGDGQYKWQRKEDSSDEEAGRGGLGRARGKRSRMEMEEDEGVRKNGDAAEANAPTEPNAPATREVEGQGDATVGGEDAVETPTTKSMEKDGSNRLDTEGNSKKKRKKKKKKKSKDRAEDS